MIENKNSFNKTEHQNINRDSTTPTMTPTMTTPTMITPTMTTANKLELPAFSNKNITIDIVIPFPESNIEKTLMAINRFSNKLPCSEHNLQDYYKNAKSNLVFYQNFNKNITNEQTLLNEIINSGWRKCFNEIKFVYANNTKIEDEYPKGASVMFYKYFQIGPPSDYFFWMEADVNPIKSNWLIEIFKTTILTQEARGNKPFYILGSNNRAVQIGGNTAAYNFYHINGNAIYWRDISWYNNFLIHVEHYYKGFKIFDVDIFYYLEDPQNWSKCAKLSQEFIHYEIIQNLAHTEYKEEDIIINSPRTFFVHS